MKNDSDEREDKLFEMLEEDTDSNIDVVDNFDIILFNQPNNGVLLEITQKKDKKAVAEMEKYKKETDY